ncbi:MAG: DEAD/DEAH box helicase [Nakamurella sp.]
MAAPLRAQIRGTSLEPEVVLSFARTAKLADGTPAGRWVRTLPSIRRASGTSFVTREIGPDAAQQLLAAGFTITLARALAALDPTTLICPVAVPHEDDDTLARVHPRLTGLAETMRLLEGRGRIEVASRTVLIPVAELHPAPVGIRLASALDRTSIVHDDLPAEVLLAARRLAAAADLDSEAIRADYALAVSHVGDIPAWFGLELDDYQRAGAIAAVCGHRVWGDPPGVGKTRQILAALAVSGCKRSIIVTPPFPVVTHWQREVEASRIAQNCDEGGQVVVFRSDRMLPELPLSGVVVVPDTLLAARPEVLSALADWKPDGFAVDEVHRCKTWETSRATAVRKLARSCIGLRLAASGTPMLAHVVEMESMLAITGQLKPVFGGRLQYEAAYARQNKFGGWTNRQRALPKLKQLLDDHVWIRRPKVMPTTKRRYVDFIDPDMKIWRDAFIDVHATIDRFLERFHSGKGRWPDNGEITEWAAGEMGLITQMRRAAGLAKVDGIAEKVAVWVAGYSEIDETTGKVTYLRPLIVWTWHQAVSEALAAAVPAKIGAAGVIIGSTPPKMRSQLVDDYQAGKIPVLVCSIPTVGVGVTLTAGCDAWFAETSWTPAEISQAEDRQYRRGQTRDVRVTTFIAPGTLDERIQDVLSRKAESLNEVLTGGDNEVGVLTAGGQDEQRRILHSIVAERITHLSTSRRRRAA